MIDLDALNAVIGGCALILATGFVTRLVIQAIKS